MSYYLVKPSIFIICVISTQITLNDLLDITDRNVLQELGNNNLFLILQGIEYLIEHGLLTNTSEDVAQFLYKGEGLNKTAIGDYLGERNDFNMKVLKSFVNLHEFSDMILVQALR